MIRIFQIIKSTRAAIDLASVMVGVIIIGIIGGVIAAAVFAVIPWAQDNGAKQQLDSVVTAESAVKGTTGAFNSDLKGYLDTSKLALKTVRVQADSASCYGAFSKSATGNYYYISSSSSKPSSLGKAWPTAKPSNYPDDCSWPTSWDAAAIQSTGKAPLIKNAEQMIGWDSNCTTKLDSNAAGVPIESPIGTVLKMNYCRDNLQTQPYETQPLSDASTEWRVTGWVATDSSTAVRYRLGTWMGPYSGPPGGALFTNSGSVKKSDGWVHVDTVIGYPTLSSGTYGWFNESQLGKDWNWTGYIGLEDESMTHLYVTGLQISKVK